MAIAILLLMLCSAATLFAVALSRVPLFRTLFLNFDGWAERSRFESGELS